MARPGGTAPKMGNARKLPIGKSQAAPGGQPTTPPSGTTPSVPSVGNAGLAANEGRGGTNLGWAALAAVVLLAIPATTVAYKVKRDRQA